MKKSLLTRHLTIVFMVLSVHMQAQTIDAYEIKFRNSFGGDDSDPYRLRKVNGSNNNNWLELQLNDDSDESFRIYGNSCVGSGCGEYSGNLYHVFDASGNAYHAGKLGFGMALNSRKIGLWDDPNNWYGLGIQSSQMRFQVGAGGRFSFLYGDNTEIFTVTGSGAVGIGTTSPSSLLNVRGSSSGELSKFETANSANSYVTVSNGAGSLNVGIGSNGSTAGYGYLWSGSGNFMIGSDGNPTLIVNGMGNGSVGIGHAPAAGYKLSVGGKVLAENVTVKLQANWPDYVFEKSYALRSLDQVKSYIDDNKHLPEIPSAKEMETKGIDVGEMNTLLLKKVEELTLYMIESNRKIEALQAEVDELRTLNKK